jgi:basic membrane lipoprotein Med (substrate-binding protein (PBP1-ABC) superfamily)
MQGVQAFYEGLKAVNPSADFRFAFTGTMEDPTKAKEAALALINEGVDIIFNMQNYGVFGLIDAVKSYDNVYLIGWYLDQWDLAPGKFIVSGIFDFKTAFFNIIKLYREGKLGGTIYDTTIWTVTYHLSDDHGMIPADVKAIVNDYWNRLWENKIVLSRQAWTG